MTEDFLQYLWKYKKFGFVDLRTTRHEELILQQVGTHNIESSGPDFFDARLIIQGQKWAGNVEVHIRSSDWYVHNHENDPAYDNVILHVVWEDDVEVYRKDNSIIPTLQLREYIREELLVRYKKLFDKNAQQWISCDKQLPEVSRFMLSNWQERLYLERLEKKSTLILKLLKDSANNWEAVLFKLLSKNFGLKTNGASFLSLANSIDFAVLRKCTSHLEELEALFFGQASLLEVDIKGEYFNTLKNEYQFLKNKYKLSTGRVEPFHFFRLRPPNFPTIRLAQLAMLYFKNHQLFSKVISSNRIEDFYALFAVETSKFWQNHYTFEKESKASKKRLTKPFVDLLLINTIIPIKFVYARSVGQNPEEDIFELITKLPFEKNSIISNFMDLNVPIENAMHSQAMIQLKNTYCDQKACLKCAIGNYLLNGE
ncbi:hypothetical protein IWQ47_000635 [Aquimarina sp. EL_43]|uniref:DUF2851 family protein n=1 Tax=unclassified Aquimarina TaxID=2627091 RepID=UPI0018C98068|nr:MULTISPECIES: DUF2851 family protein [unclassified Aquimarina]MBG6128674.1 hypothetical protein [Aquimarina sp. EL_35]MBG6149737.1 hypothetical protein [Aquimarina sp. EL_32]MBG6167577.1 hypothetical protein [Aquimarina sp. EL_43]